MFKPDVLVEIRYDIGSPEKTVICTNARKEALEEIIGNWVLDQMFRPSKESGAPEERPVYVIKIGLRIEDDAFAHESDTNNDALTVGIVIDVLHRLSVMAVEDLS